MKFEFEFRFSLKIGSNDGDATTTLKMGMFFGMRFIFLGIGWILFSKLIDWLLCHKEMIIGIIVVLG